MGILEFAKGDRVPLAKNFVSSEFACRGRGCCDRVQVDTELVDFLQAIREHFGQPVTVNSGYRCRVHHRAVGGAEGSRHTQGMAADIAVAGVAPAAVAQFAESLGVRGIGLYETQADGYFVHIDTREQPSFWYGQRQLRRDTFGGYGAQAFRRELAAVLAVAEDGLLAAAPTLGEKWNARHPAVRPVQKYFAALGYREVGAADGVAGEKFTAAVTHFQQDQGCQGTGCLEQWGITWHRLLGRNGNE